MSERSRIAILGAGPAGLGAALQLTRQGKAAVTVIEAEDVVGGNARSFAWEGHRLDFGSHRLHPATDPEILTDISELLGNELLDRPRHGRIRLRGRWIHFPLKPADLVLNADKRFVAGVVGDMTGRLLRRPNGGEETFASVLEANLGGTICRDFYFPYAKKIWGHGAGELSAIQARRRVSAGSFGKLLKKIASALPGIRRPTTGRFYYPRRGFGAISEAYAAAALAAGAEFLMGWRATELRQNDESWTVTVRRNGEARSLDVDYVWSTIPLTILTRIVRPEPPHEITAAASAMRFRSMILVFLKLPVEHFTEYDAHYFPGADVGITRLSEPKNYAARTEPRDSTVICAELPCSTDDRWWAMSDEDLGDFVAEQLERAALPLPAKPSAVLTRKLTHAYPIYLTGYEAHFDTIDEWARQLPRLLSYGRQGLFAHDNTHHALSMAYAAADCLRNGTFDSTRWSEYRKDFERHVVED